MAHECFVLLPMDAQLMDYEKLGRFPIGMSIPSADAMLLTHAWQIHYASEKLFVDFAGATIPLTGCGRAHICVADLGPSCYTFACVTPHETMADWLDATGRTLHFIGGVPQLIAQQRHRA